ncbi:hypothetical protein Bca101_031045 [Brassica carinata]
MIYEGNFGRETFHDLHSSRTTFSSKGYSFCIEWSLLLIRSDDTKLFVAWFSASMYPVVSYLRDSSRNMSLIEISLKMLAEEHWCRTIRWRHLMKGCRNTKGKLTEKYKLN